MWNLDGRGRRQLELAQLVALRAADPAGAAQAALLVRDRIQWARRQPGAKGPPDPAPPTILAGGEGGWPGWGPKQAWSN